MSECDYVIEIIRTRFDCLDKSEKLNFAKRLFREVYSIISVGNYNPLWGLVKNALDIASGLITKIQESGDFMWDSEASYQSAQAKIKNYDEMRTKYEEYRSIIGKVKGALNDERQ